MSYVRILVSVFFSTYKVRASIVLDSPKAWETYFDSTVSLPIAESGGSTVLYAGLHQIPVGVRWEYSDIPLIFRCNLVLKGVGKIFRYYSFSANLSPTELTRLQRNKGGRVKSPCILHINECPVRH